MASTSKHQARDNDRISALPDTLVCHILSFLPTLYAVRTTVLSSRWKNMWISVTTLDFNARRDFNTRDFNTQYLYDSYRFTSFVDRVLLFRGSSDIHKFRLEISCDDQPDRGFFSHIDAWICTAVRRNVVELDLTYFCLWAETYFQMPQSLFTCKTLRVLKVSSTAISFDPPASGCFPSLKLVHIRVPYLDETSMQKMFSCCPVLENLTIWGPRDKDMNWNFNVHAPELKTLSIDCIASLCIKAPKLENLVLMNEINFSEYLLDDAKSIISASINFTELDYTRRGFFPMCGTAVLAAISNVKYLSLSVQCLEARHLPVFSNLTHLEVVLYYCNYWEVLEVLLKRAPNLEVLVLEDKTKCNQEYSELRWNQPAVVPMCLLSHLKTISIQGFKGRPVEMEVAKYLLENGNLLNWMILYACELERSWCKKEELYKEFLMFHRARTCKVEFIDM